MLQWKESYESGVKEVDEQHQKLFKMVNDFEELVLAKKAEQRFEDALKFLGNYVTVHFSCEESCMAQMKCSAAAQNKKAHAEFLNVFQSFVGRFKSEGYSDALANELLRTVQKWLIQHICGVDVRLKQCTTVAN
jgi:hemerythrin